MLGAILGDVAGSTRERRPVSGPDFELLPPGSRFTDDSVLTVAQMDQLLHGLRWRKCLVEWFRLYPRAGYGGRFAAWCMSGGGEPYGSWGNGSAMRVSPVGWFYTSLEEVLEAAAASARVTHDHPQGILGAQAVAGAVFLARSGESRDAVRGFLREHCGYPMDRTLEEIRPGYRFDVSCQGSVPEALQAALESEDVEGAIRGAISLGGDADTQACIAGAVAEAFSGGVPQPLVEAVWGLLDGPLRRVARAFYRQVLPEVGIPPEL